MRNVNIFDPDAVEKLVGLEQALGWTDKKDLREIRKDFYDEVENLLSQRSPEYGLRSFSTLSRDQTIYGVGGWNRYGIEPDGTVFLIYNLVDNMDQDAAKKIAEEKGFKVK